MRILVTGGYGQLGTALKEVLKDEAVLLTDSDSMDITDVDQVGKVFNDFKPDWLVHGAAFTNVDGCEESPELADKVNHLGTKILAQMCKKADVKMIYIGTDYTFDGTKDSPYTEDDEPNPQSVYGRTKLEGEEAVQEILGGYILRTAWVYGEGNNFIQAVLNLSGKMDEIKVVNDQFGRPTYALDLAKAIYDVIKKEPEVGIYNVTGGGDVISWADFAEEIFKIVGKNTKVTGISTEEYFAGNKDKKIAPRPAYSALDLTKSKEVGLSLSDWPSSLKNYLNK
ncbi:MAG: dTDP-4-dehydrorhamnose reductase [bacterium]|nr:dTDP-4-dehydrorhamnose reductase [bacterium]